MSNKNERLADRFADIFIRLHSNEQLCLKQLAQTYQVSEKTIRRDLLRMESYLPLIRRKGLIYLDNSKQFDLTHKEFGELIRLIGVHNLLPNMDIGFLRELLKQKTDSVFQIKGYDFEDATQFETDIATLNQAIKHHRAVNFIYKERHRTAHPYKIVHHRGCWYFVGTQDGEIKTYRLSKISHLMLNKETFEPDEDAKQIIDNAQGIWFGKQSVNVLVQTDAYAMPFFLQKSILPEQKVISKQDGGLLLQSTVYQQAQIFPMIRSWIPHLRIIEPKDWQDDLEMGIRGYLQQNR